MGRLLDAGCWECVDRFERHSSRGSGLALGFWVPNLLASAGGDQDVASLVGDMIDQYIRG